MPDFLAEVLTRPENREYLLQVRTAFSWKVPPSSQLLSPDHDLTKKEVRQLDQKLRAAYQILKDESCSSCGVVGWYGRTVNPEVQFDVEISKCMSCEAKDSVKKELKPGETRYASPYFMKTMPDGTVVRSDSDGPGREEWYDELRKEAIAEREKKASDFGK